ncbi:hypothetical protein SAMN04488098_103314 [Alkalibacterium thalassium]|uniref:Uncharacterized protein n=1 Tax=Alkalibacterium thalassium TaxID=426701 RepID=A0A1G9C9I1_9LACT|nr:hypothetical protein SAMN04488098_103314 [Alkalibacterium thalassium]
MTWWKEAVVYQIYPRSFQIRMETASEISQESSSVWITYRHWGWM